MLARIGVESIDDLFAQIPDGVRLDRPLELPDGMSESKVYRFLAGLADTNLDAERIPSFLGAGDVRPLCTRDRRCDRQPLPIPHPVHAVPARGFPGWPAGDVRVPDGDERDHRPAGFNAGTRGLRRLPRRPTWQWARPNEPAWLPRGLHPHSRETLATHAVGFGATLTEVGLEGGLTNGEELEAAVGDDTAAVFLQNPNFLGAVEDITTLGEAVGAKGAC